MLSMVAFGFDRYNVMVKGLEGFEMTYPIALGINAFIWVYCIAVCIPPFFGWGGYALGNISSKRFKFTHYMCITSNYRGISCDMYI